ncbi:MAG TPA: hypothetical protein VI485_32235 [Vicinamibacterales bacterium]|nr:hypothetical protein [Vicinamibacterales bacterium]
MHSTAIVGNLSVAIRECSYPGVPAVNIGSRQQGRERGLCGGDVLVALTHRDWYGFPAQASACTRCGLVFLNPRMTAKAYGRFYDGVCRPLVSAFHGRLIDARTIQAEQREYAADRTAFVRPFIDGAGPRTMQDIGGSTGVVAAHFAQTFGLAGTLIDPAPLQVEQARTFGLETIAGWSKSTTSATVDSTSC